ncbi:MAG: DNA repair protein RecN [Candidatus Eisenbacteria bacterium]|nr:DNA repair protein RecN [Candidatus Eisenbacteria bacterium]
MLERLIIRDLALVERAEVPFGPGLNVVTGETGAGKSLLVQAVDLLMGGRADAGVVRDGAPAAVAEGEFRVEGDPGARVAALLAGWGIECDGETVIVRREVQAGGKSRALVNQSAVTRGALAQLGDILADLHGQHEHQSLLRAEAGLDVLDRLADLGGDVTRYGEALAAWRAASAELAALETSLATYADRREWMEQAARELAEADLVEGEEERLKLEAARLAHADRLRALVGQALAKLSEGDDAALDAIAVAARAVEQAASLDPSLADTLLALDEARIAAAEAGRALAAYGAGLEADPQALETIEARRELIARLQRRYRRGIAELIAWRAELAQELATGEDGAGALERARTRAAEAEAKCLAAGHALSRKRRAAAREWGAGLTRGLEPLGFPHARLEFLVAPAGGDAPAPGARGLDRVEMLFTANPGEPARPLHKIASGGELSRVMLALKTALEAQDPVDLLLFDEVDSGIGGAVAQAVGERLRRLSRHRQIVCVTHLPMIASLATHHVRVTKRVTGGRTVARIEPVAGEERVDELARMLAGERVTETTRRQARELLADAPARPAGVPRGSA